MDFIKGQKVQALDELGRWEEARVVDISGDCVHVSFVGWSRDFDLEVKMDDVRELVDPFHMPGHGRGVKRRFDIAGSQQLAEMRLLAKDDVVQFQDGDVEREGHVVVVDRFRRSLDVEVDGQRITVPVQHLKPKALPEFNKPRQTPKHRHRKASKKDKDFQRTEANEEVRISDSETEIHRTVPEAVPVLMSTNGTLIQRGRCYRLSNTDVSVAAVDIKGSQISGPMIIGGNIDHDVQVSMPAERACLPSRDSVPTLGKSDRDYLATLGLENQPEQEKLANASVSVRKAVRSALLGHLVRKEVSSALKNKSCRKTVCLGIVAMEHDMSILGIDTKSRKMIYSYKDGNMDQLDSLLGMRWDVSPIDKTHFRFVTQVVFKVKDLMLSMGVYCAICRSCFSDSYRSEIQNKDMKECIEEEDHSSDLEL